MEWDTVRSGEIIQDLIWEQYPYPVALEKITAGNSSKMIFNANPATARMCWRPVDPPRRPPRPASAPAA